MIVSLKSRDNRKHVAIAVVRTLTPNTHRLYDDYTRPLLASMTAIACTPSLLQTIIHVRTTACVSIRNVQWSSMNFSTYTICRTLLQRVFVGGVSNTLHSLFARVIQRIDSITRCMCSHAQREHACMRVHLLTLQ